MDFNMHIKCVSSCSATQLKLGGAGVPPRHGAHWGCFGCIRLNAALLDGSIRPDRYGLQSCGREWCAICMWFTVLVWTVM